MTDIQQSAVRNRLDYLLGFINTDALEREQIIDAVIDDVVSDIDECAGWQDIGEDEWCDADTDYALSRVLLKRLVA